MGSGLYQIQNGKPKLIAHASKRLLEAAKNYSITELKMCGLFASFVHLLKKVHFDAAVDHLGLVHILNSKAEPATTRIKRLLEVLSEYSFNLYYMKGRDMILSDFLSKQRTDDSNPHEIIPTLFDMQAILRDRYYNMGQEKESRYQVQTQSQAKTSRIKLLAEYGVDKGVDPSVKPEKQILKAVKLAMELNPQSTPRLGQGTAGLWRKMKIPVQIQPQIQTSGVDQVKEQTLPKQTEVVQPPLTKLTTDRSIGHMLETPIIPNHTIRPKINTSQVPFYPDPLNNPLPDCLIQRHKITGVQPWI